MHIFTANYLLITSESLLFLIPRSYFESDDECLSVWIQIGDKWCPSGVSMGASALQHLHQ